MLKTIPNTRSKAQGLIYITCFASTKLNFKSRGEAYLAKPVFFNGL